MAVANPQERKSALVQAIEARPREYRILPVGMTVGVLIKPIQKIAFRVNVKAEEIDAVERAYRYLKNKDESTRTDPDVLPDTKATAALWYACREVKTTIVTEKDALGVVTEKEVDEVTNYPAFQSPEWMLEYLTIDQIAVLNEMHKAVRRELSPIKEFDQDSAEIIVRTIAGVADVDIPAAMLSRMSRDGLVSLIVHASKCLAGARAALAESEKQPEGHRLIDVELAAMTLHSRAEKTGDADMKAKAATMLEMVSVLRAEKTLDDVFPGLEPDA